MVDGAWIWTSTSAAMATKDLHKRLEEACDAIHSRIDVQPQVGLVLGSGLGAFADSLDEATSFGFEDIPNMPTEAFQDSPAKRR